MNLLKSSFSNVHPIGQFFILLCFSFGGMMVGTTLATLIQIMLGNGLGIDVTKLSFGALHTTQIITATFMFVLPAISCALLFNKNPSESHLKLSMPDSWIYALLTILFLVAIQPVITVVGFYNEQLALPESMTAIEQIMRSFAESNNKIIEIMLSNSSVAAIILNLAVIAFLAALGEELFFRGCMQQITIKIVKNIHAGIWITAIIFSAIHFDIYGFLPRVLLGAMLGYIFVWTGNLWYAILAHFLNNAAIVILQQVIYKSDTLIENDFSWNNDIWYVVGAAIGLPLIIYFFRRHRATSSWL